MEYLLLAVGSIICAVLAIRATRLLSASLWLAGVSVFTAIILYCIGARTMAVIELSLSVGLITILLVFAISMVGANSPDQLVPRRFNWLLIAAAVLLIVGLTLPFLQQPSSGTEFSFAHIFWQLRQADVLAQIAMIFAGVLGVLGLLAEPRREVKKRHTAAAPIELRPTEPPKPVAAAPEREREPEAV